MNFAVVGKFVLNVPIVINATHLSCCETSSPTSHYCQER